jgi:hypothetical protein
MKTQYSARPFADEFTGSIVQDSLAALLLRGSSAIGGGVALTAVLAAVLGH